VEAQWALRHPVPALRLCVAAHGAAAATPALARLTWGLAYAHSLVAAGCAAEAFAVLSAYAPPAEGDAATAAAVAPQAASVGSGTLADAIIAAAPTLLREGGSAAGTEAVGVLGCIAAAQVAIALGLVGTAANLLRRAHGTAAAAGGRLVDAAAIAAFEATGWSHPGAACASLAHPLLWEGGPWLLTVRLALAAGDADGASAGLARLSALPGWGAILAHANALCAVPPAGSPTSAGPLQPPTEPAGEGAPDATPWRVADATAAGIPDAVLACALAAACNVLGLRHFVERRLPAGQRCFETALAVLSAAAVAGAAPLSPPVPQLWEAAIPWTPRALGAHAACMLAAVSTRLGTGVPLGCTVLEAVVRSDPAAMLGTDVAATLAGLYDGNSDAGVGGRGKRVLAAVAAAYGLTHLDARLYRLPV
jgi:hypothetical protein